MRCKSHAHPQDEDARGPIRENDCVAIRSNIQGRHPPASTQPRTILASIASQPSTVLSSHGTPLNSEFRQDVMMAITKPHICLYGYYRSFRRESRLAKPHKIRWSARVGCDNFGCWQRLLPKGQTSPTIPCDSAHGCRLPRV